MEDIHLPSPDEIRSKINSARKEREMTQKELAAKIGTSESTFSGYKNGNRPFAYETIYEIWSIFQDESTADDKIATDLMKSGIEWAHPADVYEDVAGRMMEKAYTQMPVREDGEFLGWITTEVLAEKGETGTPIRELVHEHSFGIIESQIGEKAVKDALTGEPSYRALLVSENGKYVGILTREDLVRDKVENK